MSKSVKGSELVVDYHVGFAEAAWRDRGPPRCTLCVMRICRRTNQAATWTPLQVSGGASMEKLEKFGGQTPMGQPGQPAELGWGSHEKALPANGYTLYSVGPNMTDNGGRGSKPYDDISASVP